MPVIFGLVVVFAIFWALFIRGALFKLILAIFAFIGMQSYLSSNFPDANHICMTIADYSLSYAVIIPLGIIILAMATTSSNDL